MRGLLTYLPVISVANWQSAVVPNNTGTANNNTGRRFSLLVRREERELASIGYQQSTKKKKKAHVTCLVVSSRKILNEVRASARTLCVSNTALHTYSYLRVALHIVWKNNDMDEKWPGSRVLIGQGADRSWQVLRMRK
jgi:hypothetical protein